MVLCSPALQSLPLGSATSSVSAAASARQAPALTARAPCRIAHLQPHSLPHAAPACPVDCVLVHAASNSQGQGSITNATPGPGFNSSTGMYNWVQPNPNIVPGP